MANEKDSTAKRFAIVKKRLEQGARAGQQEQQQAARRHFARTGMTGSGAALKQQQILQEKGQQKLQAAREAGELGEMAERARQEEIEKQRQFMAGEREAGQQFSAAQAKLQRQFMAGEREAGQQFSAAQAKLQRNFISSERLASQGFSREMQSRAEQLQREAMALQESQFKDQMDMALKQFNLDKRVSEFNMNMAEQMANKRTLMEKMIDPFGAYQEGDKYSTSRGFISGGLSPIVESSGGPSSWF